MLFFWAAGLGCLRPCCWSCCRRGRAPRAGASGPCPPTECPARPKKKRPRGKSWSRSQTSPKRPSARFPKAAGRPGPRLVSESQEQNLLLFVTGRRCCRSSATRCVGAPTPAAPLASAPTAPEASPSWRPQQMPRLRVVGASELKSLLQTCRLSSKRPDLDGSFLGCEQIRAGAAAEVHAGPKAGACDLKTAAATQSPPALQACGVPAPGASSLCQPGPRGSGPQHRAQLLRGANNITSTEALQSRKKALASPDWRGHGGPRAGLGACAGFGSGHRAQQGTLPISSGSFDPK